MNEYQQFVADKAQVLIDLMGQIGQSDREVGKLLEVMRSDLEKIVGGAVQLPTHMLDGWGYYFSPEGPDGIYERYSGLVNANAELAFALRRADMDSYLRAERFLKDL
jgi:hypothetical protein